MGVRNTKDTIKEARLKAGLTQERLAEGVCSPQALSRIESGVSGVSPATFQALMEHAGAPCECFPIFADRNDFDCYCSLKYARFHLDTWQLDDAYEELRKSEEKDWTGNKLYYQEWLLLHCELQFFSYCYSHEQNRDTLLAALHVTRPHISLFNFHKLLLSQTEIRLLLFLAQEYLYLGDSDTCIQICTQLDGYLTGRKFSMVEKNQLQALLTIVQTKCLISAKDFQHALQKIDFVLQNAKQKKNTSLLFSLTFLKGLCHYYIGELTAADSYIKAAFYSSHAVDSCYATACRRYLINHTDYPLSDYMKNLPSIPVKAYPAKVPQDSSRFTDGIFNSDMTEAYTLGHILRDLRLEQGVSQRVICQGLCGKSKLSKIENNLLQPDIALAEALLQRLGLSERIFTFWGNEREAKFYELKFKLLDIQHWTNEKKIPYLEEMAGLLRADDVIYRQQYLFAEASLLDTPGTKIDALTEALRLTLPNFNIYELCHYRLTWAEIAILNNIASAYRHAENSYLSSVFFSQLLEYKKKINPSLRLQANTFSFSFCKHCENLYSQKHFQDILAFWRTCDFKLLKHSITCYSYALFYYSQALGECKHYDELILPAVYCYNIDYLAGLYEDSELLIKGILEDFSIKLEY